MPEIDIEFDGKAVITSFERFAKIVDTPEFRQAIIDAAVVCEGKVKKELREQVYDKPERSSYKRKMGAGLFGATKATKKVDRSRSEIKSAVISAKEYAVYVQMGTGIHAKGGKGRKTPWLYRDADGNFHWTVGQHPKPYMTAGLKNAKIDVMKILGKYLMRIVD